MEDEIDIYADLPNFNLGDNDNLAEKNKRITEKCLNLEKQVADLTQSLESLRKINYNLEVNLSSLLQTAKAEIARKDRMIAENRRQLDDMQFRRGEYTQSSSTTTRRSPSRRRRKYSPEERNRIVQEPEVPDKPEFVCDGTPRLSSNDDGNTLGKPSHLDGIISTVFGERLRKRILEEQEEERKQQEQSRARTDLHSKKITELNTSNKIAETDLRSGSKADDSVKLDSKVKSRIKGEHCNRKRHWEDTDSLSSRKKFRSSEVESRSSKRSHSLKNPSESKSKNETSAGMDTDARYHIVDEYTALEDGGLCNTGDNDAEDRHNKVAIRLMLLAEGIDPDVDKTKSLENGEKKIVEDKRENDKRRARSKSRSRSRNRRHNLRSRSRTPDQHHRSRRRSRARDDRSVRRSRDRFEKRRDLKNKDGDNLSEFSREIHELKERFEHRIDDGPGNRADKGRGFSRLKRNDERVHKSGKSKTPDSSRSGSKDRTLHRSRPDKPFGTSRSRERHRSRNKGRRYSKDDDIPTKHAKTDIPRTEKTQNVEALPFKASSQATGNPETQSLVSLEDGEIVDSVESSPVKAVTEPVRSSIEKVVPPEFNLIDSNELVSKLIDVRPSLPLREIENSQKNEMPQPIEKLVLPVLESCQPMGLVNDSLNSSRDEKIENIAEFIASYPTNTSELKNDEESNEIITNNNLDHETRPDAIDLKENHSKEMIQSTRNTVCEDPSQVSSVVPAAENVLNAATCNKADNDWCLIALDSPIKNFEENRKNRSIAQSVWKKEMELPKAATPDAAPLLEQLNDTSETLCANETTKKKDSEGTKVVSEKPSKPVIQPVKIISRIKPSVLKLRSTYHKGRKEMVLSDTNSEQCTKISMPRPVEFRTKRLSNESEVVSHSEEEANKPEKLENMERNSSSQKDQKKPSVDELFGDENDSKNIADDKETITEIKSDINIAKTVDKGNKNSGKSKANNIKTRNAKPERRSSTTKESKSTSGKMTAVKADSSKTSKTDETKNKSIGSTKNKTGSKVDKTCDNVGSDIGKCLENGNKPVKAASKGKAEGSNSKQKKEPQKLIVARRRKPVNLEDSSTFSSIGLNRNSLGDKVDDSEKSVAHNIGLSDSVESNSKTSINQNENQAQTMIARNKSANDDRQTAFSNVKKKPKL